jgi:hypothetical protein
VSIPLREPHYSYEALVQVVTLNYQVEDLPALEAAACEPGERLWLAESDGRVYRVWLKGRGTRARWRMDCEHALVTEERVSGKLAGTVLARLQRPGSSREYALEPGLAETDLATLDELERVWLSGARHGGFLEPRSIPLRGEGLVRGRIKDIEADLGRAKALRARNLLETCGDDAGQVAAEFGIEVGAARDALAVREKYHAWIRAGAAASRETFPVRKPAGPTGLPDDLATRLMTAACETETVLPGKAYPEPLPAGLAPWHVYIEAIGHCVAVAVDGVYQPDGDPWEYMAVAPVSMVRREGWTMRDGLILAAVPYNMDIGAVECEESDYEF